MESSAVVELSCRDNFDTGLLKQGCSLGICQGGSPMLTPYLKRCCCSNKQPCPDLLARPVPLFRCIDIFLAR